MTSSDNFYESLEQEGRARDILRKRADNYFGGMPGTLTSKHTPSLFYRFAGMTQKELEADWAKGKGTTTCNGVTQRYAYGVMRDNKKAQFFGFFKQRDLCRIAKLEPALVIQADDPSARPEYGDVVRMKRYHVCVSFDFTGGQWNSMDGGQGGPKTGHDVVKRVTQPYNPALVESWVNMAKVLLMTEKIK